MDSIIDPDPEPVILYLAAIGGLVVMFTFHEVGLLPSPLEGGVLFGVLFAVAYCTVFAMIFGVLRLIIDLIDRFIERGRNEDQTNDTR